ncbi:unnamed protein product [Orchesella dallaii]|uniref:Uncharacterized protein n=1 Tax=Orchesella dallaii TaxID=48710 RepID=A0ABP1Q5G2_9HEXA
MSLPGVTLRTKVSKWHALERRHSPLIPDVQDWEHLPYHFGLQEEIISQRRNIEKCPHGLEKLMLIKEVTIEKHKIDPVNSRTSFLFCKKSCNNLWNVFTPTSQGKKQKLLFQAEKSSSCRVKTCCIAYPIEFGVYHPNPTPLKDCKEPRSSNTAILHCSGFPTVFGGASEILVNYMIQMPGERKSLAVPLGNIYKDNLSSCRSLIAHGLPLSQSMFKVCKQKCSQNSTRCFSKTHHFVRCVDEKIVGRLYKSSCPIISNQDQEVKKKKCGHTYQKNDSQWRVEFSDDSEPIIKALILCTALCVIDGN